MGKVEMLRESVSLGRIADLKTVGFGAVLFWITVLSGCGTGVQPSFAGVFVKYGSSEFSEAYDTLRLEKAEGTDYMVHRSTGIILIDERGRKAKPIVEKKTWKVQFDAERSVLVHRSMGREFRLEGDGLRMENGLYHRLK